MYLFDKRTSNFRKACITIALAVRISLVLAMLSAFINNKWLVLFVSGLTLFLTFLPSMIQDRYNIYFPIEVELIAMVFVYATLFLGDAHGYYTKFWWWDVVLHSASGLVFGLAGFLIMYALWESKKVTASAGIIALFSFCFSVAIGALWEITEFAIDYFFKANMQKSGLVDTMWDLIVDSISALIAALLGYSYLKGGKTHVFDNALKRFTKNQ
ncbi:MAG: hypothetical protein OXR66_01310 [Candidatus Woesearchaeota archaeon]|nr:hypothetical protein [Candidatus Woesearchaeota archaeon]